MSYFSKSSLQTTGYLSSLQTTGQQSSLQTTDLSSLQTTLSSVQSTDHWSSASLHTIGQLSCLQTIVIYPAIDSKHPKIQDQ